MHKTLTKLFPDTPSHVLLTYARALLYPFAQHDISTVNRQAAFLAQIGHESGGFRYTAENLNYSAEGLQRIWSTRFTPAKARAYAHNPEKIANFVYANRMSNGNEASGDGWRFRGRGLIQITGRENYTALAKYLGKTLTDTIAYIETPHGAVASAAWFWSKHKLNQYADKSDFLTMTRRINGGLVGLQHRVTLYQMAKKLLSK